MHPQTVRTWPLGLSEPTTCFRMIGKEICVQKVGPVKMQKGIGYKICDKMTKTGTADRMKCSSKIYFKNSSRAIYVRKQVLD